MHLVCLRPNLCESKAMQSVDQAVASLESASARLLSVPNGLGLRTACVSFGTDGGDDVWKTWGAHGDATIREMERVDRPSGAGFFNMGDCAAACQRLDDVVSILKSVVPASQCSALHLCQSIATALASEIRAERPDLKTLSVSVWPRSPYRPRGLVEAFANPEIDDSRLRLSSDAIIALGAVLPDMTSVWIRSEKVVIGERRSSGDGLVDPVELLRAARQLPPRPLGGWTMPD